MAIVFREQPAIGALEIALMAGSGALHTGYFMALARAYKHGDLTLVYPLARGSGPWLATLGALVLLGERPSALAWLGIGLVAVGILLLTGDPRALRQHESSRAVGYALLTGVFIAAYTVWDRFAVGSRAIPPLVYFWGLSLTLLLFLAPLAVRGPYMVKQVWREHWRLAVAIGVLSALAYILVLTALAITPVSFVAPIRETSVLFASVLGARFLSEGQMLHRALAAVTMVLGIIVLALS